MSSYENHISGSYNISMERSYTAGIYLYQGQQWKHQNNVWNVFKVTITWCLFIVNFKQILQIALWFSLLISNN